jgi:hypothetical protein
VEGELSLSELQSDGSTTRKHLESIWRQTGVMPADLDVPECPAEVRYLWHWFLDLNRTRTSGMGIGPITYSEIAAWAQLMGIAPRPFEVHAVKSIDSVFIAYHSRKTS